MIGEVGETEHQKLCPSYLKKVEELGGTPGKNIQKS